MQTLDIFASILAGLGLFFVGTKGIAANLSQLAGRSLRQWVARSTGNYAMSAVIGTLAGALVQSTNAITVILMSMAKAEMITPRQARPILVWSNVGTSVLVLAVAIDIHLFVLLLTATTGVFYYLNLDRSPRWRPFVAALLAISLLFLGLQLMHDGNHELRSIDWVREFFQMSARWSVLAFGVGVILAVALQSSSTVAVIAISMSAAGLFTLDQALLTVLGASVGSGLSTYIVVGRHGGLIAPARHSAGCREDPRRRRAAAARHRRAHLSRSAAGGAHPPDHQRYRQTGGARLSRLPDRRRRGAGGLRPRP